MFSLQLNEVLINDFEQIRHDTNSFSNLNNKSILLTGGTGLIGSYLISYLEYLINSYDYNIDLYILVRHKTTQLLDNIAKSISVIEGDLRYHIHELTNFTEKFDIILHLGSPASPRNFTNRTATFLPNIVGTSNLLPTLRPSGIFFLASTTGVYGSKHQNQLPFTETSFGSLDCLHNIACYLESKRAAETLVDAYCWDNNLDYRIARMSICFGPGIKRNDGRLFSDICYSLLDQTKIQLTSDGTAIRNFTYLSDCVTAVLNIIFNGSKNSVFNLASSQSMRVIDLAERLSELYQLNQVEFVMPAKTYKRFEVDDSTVDVSKLEGLGWCRRYDTIETFKRTIEYLTLCK